MIRGKGRAAKALSLLVVSYKSFTKSSELCGNVANPWRTKPRSWIHLAEVILLIKRQCWVIHYTVSMQGAAGHTEGREQDTDFWVERMFLQVWFQNHPRQSCLVCLSILWAISRLLNKNFGWFGLELYGLTFFPENFVYPKVREPLLLSFHSMKNKTN